MSKYTTQLRWIVEQVGEGEKIPRKQQYADKVYKYLGLSDYPIFEEEYRHELNDLIINHFYFREIGFETAAQFAWYMKRTMREIMPKYNMMYIGIKDYADHPLSDYARHKTETWNAHVDDVSNSQTRAASNGETQSADHYRSVYQDTPMSMLNNHGSPNVENLDYATSVTYNDDNSNSETKSNTNSQVDSDRDRDDTGERITDEYGRNKSFAALVKEFAEDFLNVDMLVLDDLEDLFMSLW